MVIHVTIDGKAIQVQEGTTVLQAAQAAGAHIPTLCHHPQLRPYGSCRLCLVEVEGSRTLQPSCTFPATPNMVVHTDTARVKAARRFVLNMLFSERNHFCPYCQVSGGDCELQQAVYGEGMTHWEYPPNWTPFPVDASHPYYVMDHNRCILCRRCIRACMEISGNCTLEIEGRGAKSMVVADMGVPLGQSSCVSCGSCVQVCPTGALIDRASAYLGHDVQLSRTRTVCVGCSVGCGVCVLTRDNHLVRIESDGEAPVNGGVLCKLGRFVPVDERRQRITTPLVRRSGKLEMATWEQALDTVAEHLGPLAGETGGGVAAVASGRLPAESLYLFKRLFADGLSGQMVTSVEEGLPVSVPDAPAQEMGGPFEARLNVLHTADCVVTMGVDLVKHHEVIGFFVKRNLLNDLKLVVIDPNDNGLDWQAHSTLKASRGADLDVLEGLIAAIVLQGLAKPSAALDAAEILESAIERTGLSRQTLVEAGRVIASAQQPVFIYSLSFHDTGQTLKTLRELAGLVGAQLISVKGQANSLAMAQYRLDQPFHLDGHQAVYVALGDDEPTERLVKQVQDTPCLIVQASYASPLTEMAEVVLPVEMWAEQEGHYLNLEGRLQAARRALQPPPEVLSNVNVLQALADRLGVQLGGDWKQDLVQRASIVAITMNEA